MHDRVQPGDVVDLAWEPEAAGIHVQHDQEVGLEPLRPVHRQEVDLELGDPGQNAPNVMTVARAFPPAWEGAVSGALRAQTARGLRLGG